MERFFCFLKNQSLQELAALMNQILTLIKNEFILDFRDRFTLGSILLYAINSAFLCLIALQEPEIEVWNILFWVMFSFSAVISAMNSFAREAGENRLYFYQIVSPEVLFLSKWLTQFLLLLVVGTILFGVMCALSYNPVVSPWQFVLVLLGGSLSLSAILSFTSSIASLSQGPAVLLSVLSFPLILPVLLLLQYLSGVSFDMYDSEQFQQYFLYLMAIQMISVGAALFLINFVWRN